MESRSHISDQFDTTVLGEVDSQSNQTSEL